MKNPKEIGSRLVFSRTDKIYDTLEGFFAQKRFHRIVADSLILIFLLGIILAELIRLDVFALGKFSDSLHNHYFAIKLAFTCLLLFELLSLVFVLPESVAKSVGKQFELFSLILLRSAFKEFEKLPEPIEWGGLDEPIIHILAYVVGAGLIFLATGYYYKVQKHFRLTENEIDRKQFISFKKVLALLLFMSFVGLGIYDIYDFYDTGGFHNSFNTYFTALIFIDILIVLISLRYSSAYHKVFRYSAFVLVTILLRIALTGNAYVQIALGIFSLVYAIILTRIYNYFEQSISSED